MKHIQCWALTALASAALALTSVVAAEQTANPSAGSEGLQLTAFGHPDARIGTTGRLFIDDIEVPTSPEQRQALMRMHLHIEDLGAKGQAIGREAEAIAAEVTAEALQAVASGRAGDPAFAAGVEASVKARLADSMQGICGSVDALVESSQKAIDMGLIELLPYVDGQLDAGDQCWSEIAALH
ncbi:hypothetical protein [Alkalisalibacterium limincola]|uniref:DUF2884 family protein n=1 Tax=Alkalisalibacterium limincola TaxID=2699169 RepID=A0A5C8KH47_9GAMM|nr:hypothetical protein [Alkalisalibacterium limincola]TXK59641.1 hypothetical protein FU658_13430 [Alkalisalibacterium limincola]